MRDWPCAQQIGKGAFVNDFAAMLAGAGAQVDDVIGGAHDVGIVLDDQDGIADLAQFVQDANRRPVSRACRPMEGSSST